MPNRPTRRHVGIVAQDPSVLHQGRILRSHVTIPHEHLDAGPRGARVHVIDYDSSARVRYRPPPGAWCATPDVVDAASDDELLNNPDFHAWNVYGIVMRTLGRFELALGRRVAWSCRGHQLWVAPHAFADANAYYSEEEGALYFGYVPGSPPLYTALSHDVVAHETSHALLDGLRARYTDPSSPEQAAFHEGFSDIVALLSVLSSPDVVDALLRAQQTPLPWHRDRIARGTLHLGKLGESPLFGLAQQLGAALVRRSSLRASLLLEPHGNLLAQMLQEGREPHDLGELPVAAMMRAYVTVWHDRLLTLADTSRGSLSRARVVEEAADLADRLLTVAIRAIDYLPVVDVRFADFVRAMITADEQVYPDDARYQIRTHLPRAFREYGIHDDGELLGAWDDPLPELHDALTRTGLHHAALQSDPTECFQFLWENRAAFEIDEQSFVRVQSVRPAVRRGDDGAFVRETVVEYVEYLELRADELVQHGVRQPDRMPDDRAVTLYGGGAVVLDEFGRVKFHVKSKLFSDKQSERLQNLWDAGRFRRELRARPGPQVFARMHAQRRTAR